MQLRQSEAPVPAGELAPLTFWLGVLVGTLGTCAGIAVLLLALLFSKDDGPKVPR